jgi:hypothetical protein
MSYDEQGPLVAKTVQASDKDIFSGFASRLKYFKNE